MASNNKSKLAVGLDLGSTATRVVICALQDDSLRFLGYGEAPVQAWNRWRLAEQSALDGEHPFCLARSRAAGAGVARIGGDRDRRLRERSEQPRIVRVRPAARD